VSQNEIIDDFVRISARDVQQSIDKFMRATENLPNDLRVRALESLTVEAMRSIRSMQEMAERLKGQAQR
jgi:hypothetical protein